MGSTDKSAKVRVRLCKPSVERHYSTVDNCKATPILYLSFSPGFILFVCALLRFEKFECSVALGKITYTNKFEDIGGRRRRAIQFN